MTCWGLVATIKAEAADILNFAAYHIEVGAHRLLIYLDAPCPEAMPYLQAHPKIRVILCDEAYWLKRRKARPDKHQVRQTLNATRAYRRQANDLDWLIHIDVDEFLWSKDSLHDILGALPQDVFCARSRPIESLGGDGTSFKAYIPKTLDRNAIIQRLYPRFGDYLKGGFLSHEQGKIFARTGTEDVKIRIHSIFVKDASNPNQIELPQVDLCHLHGKSWHDWFSRYRYRLEKGSYRAEMKPNRSRDKGGVTLHELMRTIESEEGETGLQAFYDEICADTPDLRSRLQDEGLLKNHDLKLEEKRRKHFPKFG